MLINGTDLIVLKMLLPVVKYFADSVYYAKSRCGLHLH